MAIHLEKSGVEGNKTRMPLPPSSTAPRTVPSPPQSISPWKSRWLVDLATSPTPALAPLESPNPPISFAHAPQSPSTYRTSSVQLPVTSCSARRRTPHPTPPVRWRRPSTALNRNAEEVPATGICSSTHRWRTHRMKPSEWWDRETRSESPAARGQELWSSDSAMIGYRRSISRHQSRRQPHWWLCTNSHGPSACWSRAIRRREWTERSLAGAAALISRGGRPPSPPPRSGADPAAGLRGASRDASTAAVTGCTRGCNPTAAPYGRIWQRFPVHPFSWCQRRKEVREGRNFCTLFRFLMLRFGFGICRFVNRVGSVQLDRWFWILLYCRKLRSSKPCMGRKPSGNRILC